MAVLCLLLIATLSVAGAAHNHSFKNEAAHSRQSVPGQDSCQLCVISHEAKPQPVQAAPTPVFFALSGIICQPATSLPYRWSFDLACRPPPTHSIDSSSHGMGSEA